MFEGNGCFEIEVVIYRADVYALTDKKMQFNWTLEDYYM